MINFKLQRHFWMRICEEMYIDVSYLPMNVVPFWEYSCGVSFRIYYILFQGNQFHCFIVTLSLCGLWYYQWNSSIISQNHMLWRSLGKMQSLNLTSEHQYLLLLWIFTKMSCKYQTKFKKRNFKNMPEKKMSI